MKAATTSKIKYFFIMGFIVLFSGPLMSLALLMLVGSIITFVFFILGLILSVAILAQLLLVTAIILIFSLTGGATALVIGGIYILF
jgi:hypothetical protein